MSFSLSKVSELDLSSESMAETKLDKLKETIDDKQAKIGDRIHALLLLLRSKHSEGENLQVDPIPTSLQLPESPNFNRPDPTPNYVINASADVTKASSPLPNRTIKCHRRISLEEIEERRLKGLCLFCEESETPNHYLLHKNSGILMIDCDEDQSCDDEELVETEVATESIETEHETVKREANASMILANLEDESMPPFQVPVSDSKILRNVEKIEVDGDVENGQKLLSIEKICCAHKVFAKMSQHKETLGIKKKQKGFKSWRFKFKHRVAPRELIQEKLVVHEAKVTRNQLRSLIGIVDDLHSNCGSDIWCVQYLVSSVVVGDLQETQWFFNDEVEDIQKLQIVIKEGINSYACLEFNGICLRSHILRQQKKPNSFLESEVMREYVQHVLWAFLHMKVIETRYAIGERDERCEVARDVNKRSMLCLTFGIRKSNAGEEHQTVYEQIIMVNEWLHQISLVLQQVMRSKKIKFPKRWMFKYKFVEEDIKNLYNQFSYKSRLELEEGFKSWSQRETIEVKQNLKNWYGDSLLEFLKRIEAGSSMIMVLYNNTELINYLKYLVKKCLVPIIRIEDALIEVRPPELFVADIMVVTKEEMEKDMKEDDQKQQGDLGHYFLLVAAANQSHLWSASYHVWHCWKARYSQNFDSQVWDPGG